MWKKSKQTGWMCMANWYYRPGRLFEQGDPFIQRKGRTTLR